VNGFPATQENPSPRVDPIALAREWLLFLREAFAHPRAVGSIIPSSPALAHRMAQAARCDGSHLVVELGAGTGAVTEALLARGIAPRLLLLVERSAALASLLRDRFPGVRVICGDAADLRRLIRRFVPAATCVDVISSLPLRSLPAEKVRAILCEIGAVLRRGGRWVQYTYALARREIPPGFVRYASSLVWQNIPPARVDILGRATGRQQRAVVVPRRSSLQRVH
jgi:phospholipid N-methyltransferase